MRSGAFIGIWELDRKKAAQPLFHETESSVGSWGEGEWA
jgi:hypothetical protein